MVSSSAFASIDEKVTHALVGSRSAFASIDEKVTHEATSSSQAFAAIDENLVTQVNPTLMYVYDSGVGEYVRAPWFIYDNTTNAWIQIF